VGGFALHPHSDAARPGRRPFMLHRAVLLAVVVLGVFAASASGDVTTSHNWAGYAAHRAGARFTKVSASWRQPVARCTPGRRTYSAFWVGLGGYSLSAKAMEQIGTELDCNAGGGETIGAWYELVPAATRDISMSVGGGDLITASVSVVGDRVTLRLLDVSDRQSFAATVTDPGLDVSSAEWIAEAPSDCTAVGCTTLPLANFGAVRFTSASAWTSGGRGGAISSPLWRTTEIVLGYSPRGSRARATPTPLARGGHAFGVDFAALAAADS
jgi:Peptidase A4 family